MPDTLPLQDVKVLDFMWVLAGPGITRLLADYGATVIRIESTNRIDPTRTVGPGIPGGKRGDPAVRLPTDFQAASGSGA